MLTGTTIHQFFPGFNTPTRYVEIDLSSKTNSDATELFESYHHPENLTPLA
jgi:hypothetical protein